MAKLTYRFEEEENKFDAPILVTRPDIGKVTAMSLGGARNGLPKDIRRDEMVVDYKTNHLYIQGPGGATVNVANVSVLRNLSERPTIGVENHLYILLRENMFSVWMDNHWKNMAASEVTVQQYDGVEIYENMREFPETGKDNKLYLTQQNQGFRWIEAEKKYKLLFGDNTWAYSKEAADATFARKDEIPEQKTLDELGGITPAEVDRRIQEEHDVIAQNFATNEDNDKKADKADVFSREEAIKTFAAADKIKTLAQMGGATQIYVDDTFFTKENAEQLKERVKQTEDSVNTLSEYRKTVDTDRVIDEKIEAAKPDLTPFVKTLDMEKELVKKADRSIVYTKVEVADKFVPKTDFNLETLGAASKKDIEVFATKTELDDAAYYEKDRTYSKEEVDSRISNVSEALEDYKKENASEHYTKKETDEAIAAFAPDGGWDKYERRKHAEDTYATKTELKTKAYIDDVYTKKQIDQRIKDIVKTGSDMDGVMMIDHEDTDAYIDKRIKDYVDPQLDSLPNVVLKTELLKTLIEQDKYTDDPMLKYFATIAELNELKRKVSKWISEKLTVETDATTGKPTMTLSNKVMIREELPLKHNPIRVYINGVRYFEGDDFTYDPESGKVTWSSTEMPDVYEKLSKSAVYAEYEIETTI